MKQIHPPDDGQIVETAVLAAPRFRNNCMRVGGAMVAVNAVFTCTQRKTGGIPAANSIARFGGAINERARKWTRHLDRESKNAIPARDVYCGEHWDAVRGLFGPKQSEEVWVTSAGYGLIPADAPIVPYSATFSGGQPDSV